MIKKTPSFLEGVFLVIVYNLKYYFLFIINRITYFPCAKRFHMIKLF